MKIQKINEQSKSKVKLSTGEVISLLDGIGIMIRANLSLSESLHLIIQQSDNPNVKKIAGYLKNAIEKGIPFHTALAHYQHIFQPLLIQMVQVGENIGNIGMILNAYVIHQKKIHSLKRKFSLSMMYPAMVFIDGVARLLDGVLHDAESAKTDSHQNGLLGCPHYTRPAEFMGMKVPDVLLSGHHEKIAEWRKQKAMELTKKNRPDLLDEN